MDLPVSVVVSIDPGIDGTGIALWNSETWDRLEPPVKCFNLHATAKAENWIARVDDLACKLEEQVFVLNLVTAVHSEIPEYFAGSVKGNAAIVSKLQANGKKEPGDVIKLVFLVGMFGEICRQYGVPFSVYTPAEWKGQLSKEIVEARITRKLDLTGLKPRSHMWDAIGIGMHAKGFSI